MDNEILEKIGLTKGESKVYLALLTLGTTKSGPLAKESGVSSSKVYKVIDRLMKKGLAGYITKGKIKYFTAVEPKRVLEYLEKREEDLQEKKDYLKNILPQLEIQQKRTPKTEAVIYAGFKACTNFFMNILDDHKPGETYHIIGAGYGVTPGLRDFFHKMHAARIKKGVKLRMLANHNMKKDIVPKTKVKAEIRYLPQYLITNMEIVFYKNKSFIVLWTDSPTGFLLHGKDTMESFKKYFDAFWKIAKP